MGKTQSVGSSPLSLLILLGWVVRSRGTAAACSRE